LLKFGVRVRHLASAFEGGRKAQIDGQGKSGIGPGFAADIVGGVQTKAAERGSLLDKDKLRGTVTEPFAFASNCGYT
jgi:hypothetical protein